MFDALNKNKKMKKDRLILALAIGIILGYLIFKCKKDEKKAEPVKSTFGATTTLKAVKGNDFNKTENNITISLPAETEFRSVLRYEIDLNMLPITTVVRNPENNQMISIADAFTKINSLAMLSAARVKSVPAHAKKAVNGVIVVKPPTGVTTMKVQTWTAKADGSRNYGTAVTLPTQGALVTSAQNALDYAYGLYQNVQK